MTRRAILTLPLVGLLAMLCVASAFDRQVLQTARVGEAPHWLSIGPRSDRQRVFQAMSRDDSRSARHYAIAAVRQAPLDPANLSLLGSLMTLADQRPVARQALAVAASLGWRDPATESYWLDQARDTNDFRLAAEHADALLRIEETSDKAQEMLVDLESVPPGREAVAGRLVADPPWRQRYFTDLRTFPANLAIDRVRTLALAARRGMRPECELSGLAAQGLLDNGLSMAAASLWYASCDRGARPTRGINDGGFERELAGHYPSPFRWRLLGSGAVDVLVRPASPPLHGSALTFHSTSSADEVIARQTTLLPPGRYQVRWLEQSRSSELMAVPTIACPRGGAGRLPVTDNRSADPDSYTGTFVVPANGCSVQTVSIVVPPSADGAIDDIWLEPVTS